MSAECPTCHGPARNASSGELDLKVCLSCCRVVAISDRSRLVASEEDEIRMRCNQQGKACYSCDD